MFPFGQHRFRTPYEEMLDQNKIAIHSPNVIAVLCTAAGRQAVALPLQEP